MMKQGDANRFYESWSGTEQLAAAAVEMFGDETFTKSAGSYKWHLGIDELDKADGSENRRRDAYRTDRQGRGA